MQLKTKIDGVEVHFPLTGERLKIGRGGDNDVVLSDFSVSRAHALVFREQDAWAVRDLGSTNGIRLNGAPVEEARLSDGDVITIGAFELEADLGGEPVTERSGTGTLATGIQPVANATIVRSLADFTAQYGLEGGVIASAETTHREGVDAGRIVGFLTRLAAALLQADSVDQVLERVMAVAFEALSVERGFILLQDEAGEVRCQLARFGKVTEVRPQREIPVSKTILDTIMVERVALLTFDAMSDQRWERGESIRIHQIRAAMSVPLWSGERIIGVMQVDSPARVGSFDQRDLDFLTAVANYAAVAVERLHYAERVELERAWRGRLERYHSPAVIEEVMRRGEAAESATKLRAAEVTVLFADLVGFTALAEQLPPEDLAEILEGFFTFAEEAIFAAGGTLDKFIGDCVMAFFGAPMEQADHAFRGVKAATQLLDQVDRWNHRRRDLAQPPLVVRVAVNSGPVVVGDIGSNRRVDYTVLGNTVNVAARLEEQAAAGGEIVIGSETQRLLAGRIPTQALDEIRLRGLRLAVRPHRVVRDVV
ncbi:MAG: FHA domain-containing protein [Acidobacteria bacterium]|nr:FHA domain-containing protein [Acidobacteriota bacterium]